MHNISFFYSSFFMINIYAFITVYFCLYVFIYALFLLCLFIILSFLYDMHFIMLMSHMLVFLCLFLCLTLLYSIIAGMYCRNLPQSSSLSLLPVNICFCPSEVCRSSSLWMQPLPQVKRQLGKSPASA
jgi:hypothetical protein